MAEREMSPVADSSVDGSTGSRETVEEKTEPTPHTVVNIAVPPADEPRQRFVAKGSFDNPAFEGLNETPETMWKPGSLKFSISDNMVDDEKVRPDESLHRRVQKLYSTHRRPIKLLALLLLFVLYNVYLGFAIRETWVRTYSYCEGVKFLVVVSAIVYFFIIYYTLLVPFVIRPVAKKLEPFKEKLHDLCERRPFMKWVPWAVTFLAILVFLAIDTEGERYRLVSAGGLVLLVAIGYVFSANRNRIIWNQVFWGVMLQFIFGIVILRLDFGKEIFGCIGNKTSDFLAFSDQGSEFVFGYLVSGKLKGELPLQIGIFAFKVLPVILFFSFCTSILYYYGIMQIMVMKVGWLLQKTVQTTACESMNAAGNIFLGMTEAPLLIKPYLAVMTKSEIHAVMTGGFATIAGGVMAAYITFGVNPGHLLSASVMSAPAALAYSKLFYPETEESQTTVENIKIEKAKEENALEAAVNGASAAISLVANVAANLIVFIAFVNFLDAMLNWFGSLVDWDFLSFEWLLSKAFVPIAAIMGVEWKDCQDVARLVGLKTIVNEFVAYKSLTDLIKDGKLTARSQAIATYALCGFSNIGSIGIQLGALGSMAPERKSELSRLGVRAMIAGSAACFMTACIAGALMYE